VISYNDDGRTWQWQLMVDWNIMTTLFIACKATWLQCRLPFRFSSYSCMFFPFFFINICLSPYKNLQCFLVNFCQRKKGLPTLGSRFGNNHGCGGTLWTRICIFPPSSSIEWGKSCTNEWHQEMWGTNLGLKFIKINKLIN
jgi:hypothetical protein